MKLITGGAGFVGSHLVDRFVRDGAHVRVADDFRSGHRDYIKSHLAKKRIDFVKGDLHQAAVTRRVMNGIDEVWHLAADPDVRSGARRPAKQFRDGAQLTLKVLEGMRRADARKIVLASSSVVYGEAKIVPTPEDYAPLIPISLYGASKLASEGLVAAYAGTYGFQSWIYRFANVVGERLTHGVIYDFHRKLKKDPKRLEILGDGKQEKSYLHTADCIDGMLHGVAKSRERVSVFNLASEGATTVDRIAQLVIEAEGLKRVRIEYTGGARGWAGDVPRMALSVKKLQGLGWNPNHSSEDAVRAAAAWIARTG